MSKVYVGLKQGLIEVIAKSKRVGFNYYWTIKCECGVIKDIAHSAITKGQSRCSIKNHHPATTHNMYHTPEHSTWSSMKQRCLDRNCKSYKNYGGKGITVCERWLNFENFYSDMGKKPEGHSLDRIDSKLGYSPENCRWATQKQQQNNRSNNVILTINNESKSVTVWAQSVGIDPRAIFLRLKRGWSPEDAVFKPIRKTKLTKQ